jgi:cytochrome P450
MWGLTVTRLSSNAIPATGWMLSHLLTPSNSELLVAVRREIEDTRQADGSVDISGLIGLPYLNSVFNETLRLYVDVLVTRTLDEDLILDQYRMSKGDIVIAPSYLGHRDAQTWNEDGAPPEDVWYGERFLKHDEKTEKAVFTTAGTNGKFFPFGGGTNICPGRVFAKQEVFGAVAAFLLAFDIQFVEYLGFDKGRKVIRRGTDPDGFPVVKKQFAGSGVVVSEGDLLVRLKRRE